MRCFYRFFSFCAIDFISFKAMPSSPTEVGNGHVGKNLKIVFSFFPIESVYGINNSICIKQSALRCSINLNSKLLSISMSLNYVHCQCFPYLNSMKIRVNYFEVNKCKFLWSVFLNPFTLGFHFFSGAGCCSTTNCFCVCFISPSGVFDSSSNIS